MKSIFKFQKTAWLHRSVDFSLQGHTEVSALYKPLSVCVCVCLCAFEPEPVHYLSCETYISSICYVSTPIWFQICIEAHIDFQDTFARCDAIWAAECDARTQFSQTTEQHTLRLPLNPLPSNLLFHQQLLTVFLAEKKLPRQFTAAYPNPGVYIIVRDNKQTLLIA